jgi:8-oxo-dGTP diphosphatase
VPLLLVRHASAGDRDEWDGPDGARPLDERGRAQAAALVAALRRYAVDRIVSSPALRCLETVAPLAVARGLAPEPRNELGEDRQGSDGATLVRELAGGDVVVCGHGGLERALGDFPRWRKAATFVLGPRLELLEVLERPRT